MPRRLITTSLILIFIGLLPRIFSLFHVPLPSSAALKLFLPPHIGQWLVDHVSFQGIAIVGIALLLFAAILVVRKLLEKHFDTKPLSTSGVLLAEVEAIHGKEPDESLLQSIKSFHRSPEQPLTEQALGEAGSKQDQGRDEVSNVSPSVFRWLNGIDPRGRTALCLSGGGIRSASFALGVLQALATHPRTRTADGEGAVSSPEKSLLAQFNYLSTVSGGGYIGSWFSAWVQRVGYASVWRDLVRLPSREQDPGEQAAPLKWLRVHSNFLTPTLGLSGDTLAGVAIVLRNLFLNWLVLLPVLCAALILMKLMALEVFRVWVEPWELRSVVGALLIWLVLLISALSFLLRNRPTRTYDEKTQASEAAFLIWVLVPSIVAAVSFTLFLALNIVLLDQILEKGPDMGKEHFLVALWPVIQPLLVLLKAKLQEPSWYVYLAGALFGAGIYGLSYAISWIRSWPKISARAWTRVRALFNKDVRVETEKSAAGNFWRWTLSGAIYGVLVTAITYLFLNQSEVIEKLIFMRLSDAILDLTAAAEAAKTLDPAAAKLAASMPRRLLALIYLGVPLMLVAQLLAEMIFVGLTSEEPNSEEDREWLGRAAGLSLLVGVAWLVVMHLAYIGTDITMRAGEFIYKNPGKCLAIVALLYVIGAVAAAVGRSGRMPAHRGAEMGAKAKTASATLSIVAVLLLVGVVVGVSALIDYMVLGRSIADYADLKTYAALADPGQARAQAIAVARYNFLLAFIAILFVGLISTSNINVNRFSLHALYRNRLIRMFLGASNQKRRPNPFTDFDREDNVAMHKMWPSQHAWNGEAIDEKQSPAGARSWRPFHVVNIALNVTSSYEHREWQERKAASFTVSPLHSGSAVTGFRDSEAYGGGISLGTAAAVSGAAASPNMGYISSAPLAFLMALFNVRLGWWLGNPGKSGEVTHTYDGPRNALVPFLAELLGMTSDTSKYVYLSDGGHFENLALYEMVRRRCRFIVVSDAGCDPDFTFEDLGNAVRKIEIDLGVPIHFRGLSRLEPRDRPSRLGELLGEVVLPPVNEGNSEPLPYHAIGTIDYPAADGPGVKSGIILYIKPGYHGTESSAAIRSYAIANPAFPHESTADQFFGESQMESYRALGFEIMDGLLRKAQDLKGSPDVSLQDVLNALKQASERGVPARPAAPPASAAAQAGA